MSAPMPPPPSLDDPAENASLEGPAEPTYVLFSVDSHGYALPVENVVAVLAYPPVTRVPTRAPHVLGVFPHRGTIVPLWDLHILFAADGPPADRPSVLVVEQGGDLFGLAVQQIDEVISAENIEVVAATELVLPAHVAGVIEGWMRATEDLTQEETGAGDDPGASKWRGLSDWVDEGAEGRFPTTPAPTAERDAAGLHSALSTSGKGERAAALLALLAPVHLLDAARLAAVGRGEYHDDSGPEVPHDRP